MPNLEERLEAVVAQSEVDGSKWHNKFLSFAAFGSKKSYYGEKKRKMKQKIKSIRSRELSAC